MKLSQFYRSAIEAGMKNDPRGYDFVTAELKRAKVKFDKLSDDEKKRFDRESLSNPYADSRILYSGAADPEVRAIAVGIDIETPELLLVERLRESRKIDMVLGHHPEGYPYGNFYKVMNMQAEILHRAGVPINAAALTLDKRISEVSRRLLPANHCRATDAARLLDLPFMSMHTAADNCVASYLDAKFQKEKPVFLQDVIRILESIEEYGSAVKYDLGPRILLGRKDGRCGRVYVDMTGGTEGAKDIFAHMSSAGIGTIVCMHLSDDHMKSAEAAHINAVIAGHISSDTLGVNLLLDQVEKKAGRLDYVSMSGFTRIKGPR